MLRHEDRFRSPPEALRGTPGSEKSLQLTSPSPCVKIRHSEAFGALFAPRLESSSLQ